MNFFRNVMTWLPLTLKCLKDVKSQILLESSKWWQTKCVESRFQGHFLHRSFPKAIEMAYARWHSPLLMCTNLRFLSHQAEIHLFKIGQHHNCIVYLHIDFRGRQSPSRLVKRAQWKTTLTAFFDSQNWFFYYWVGIFGTFNSFWSTWRSISNWYIWWRNLSYPCSCE